MPGAIWKLQNEAELATNESPGGQASYDTAKALTESVGGLLQVGPGLEAIILGAFAGNKTCLDITTNNGKRFLGGVRIIDRIDPTKSAFLDPSLISPGIERTILLPDWGGFLPLPADAGLPGDVVTSLGPGVQPIYAAPASTPTLPHDILDGTVHPDTLAGAVAIGALIRGNGTPKWSRLLAGTEGQILSMVSGLPEWGGALVYIPEIVGDPTVGIDADWVDTGDSFIQDSQRQAAATSWPARPVDVAAAVDRIIILTLATHEAGIGVTPTGVSNVHTSITDTKGNTWIKHSEYTSNFFAGIDTQTVSIWSCVVTNALTVADTLTFNFALAIPCIAVESRQFTSTQPAPTVTLISPVYRADVDSDPGLLTISGMVNRQHLFVRAMAIHGGPGAGDINLYNVSANYTEFITPHVLSTIQVEAADRQIGARGEFRIFTGTGDVTDPSLDPPTFPDTASIMAVLVLNASPVGDLIIRSTDDPLAASLWLHDTEIYAASEFFYFQNRGGGALLSHVRGSDGAFVGPVVVTPGGNNNAVSIRAAGNHTGQVAAIGATTLATAPPIGMYRISGFLNCTAAGGGNAVLQISWTDNNARANQTVCTLDKAATNYAQGSMVIYVGSGDVSYNVTYAGTGTYSARIRMEAI